MKRVLFRVSLPPCLLGLLLLRKATYLRDSSAHSFFRLGWSGEHFLSLSIVLLNGSFFDHLLALSARFLSRQPPSKAPSKTECTSSADFLFATKNGMMSVSFSPEKISFLKKGLYLIPTIVISFYMAFYHLHVLGICFCLCCENTPVSYPSSLT